MAREDLVRLRGKHRLVAEELADVIRRLGDLEADSLADEPWELRRLYAANIRQARALALKAEGMLVLPFEILEGVAS